MDTPLSSSTPLARVSCPSKPAEPQLQTLQVEMKPFLQEHLASRPRQDFGYPVEVVEGPVEIHLIPMDPVALAQGRAKGSAYRASRVS